MGNGDIIHNMDDLKQCAEYLILYTQAQEMPVVESTIKISRDFNFEAAMGTFLDIITSSSLSETHEIASNLMTIMRDSPYREFKLTISIR